MSHVHLFLFCSFLTSFPSFPPSLPQVSTWFANARRRLKKENKVTWSPRACKSSDDRGCDDDSDEAEKPLKNDKDLPGKQELNQSVSTFCMFQGLLKVWWAGTDLALPVWFIIADQQCADLQSDLEDFDLLESDGSDCEPKPQFLSEEDGANKNTDLPHGHLTHNPDPLHGKERLSPDCPKLTPVQQQNNGFYPNPDRRSTDTKPKIWSIAHTAVSLDGSLQPEYPPCMMSSTGSSSPGYPSNMALTKAERQQESPVATLREWVDGVFHGPPFQQPKPAEVWKGLNDGVIDSRQPGQSFELVRSVSSL